MSRSLSPCSVLTHFAAKRKEEVGIITADQGDPTKGREGFIFIIVSSLPLEHFTSSQAVQVIRLGVTQAFSSGKYPRLFLTDFPLVDTHCLVSSGVSGVVVLNNNRRTSP